MKIVDQSNVDRLLAVLAELERLQVEIGVFGEDDSHLLMVARVHEFGCQINVTPRMRGWFLAQGYPLRRSTTQINIPERSYMRSSFDESENDLIRVVETLLGHVIDLKLSPREFYERVGIWVVSRIQAKIQSLQDPPLAAMTIERKGSSNPLIDEGRLYQSITYRVVGA